jgi:hypothetical protein
LPELFDKPVFRAALCHTSEDANPTVISKALNVVLSILDIKEKAPS